MPKRLLIGLLKGLAVGGAIGAGLQIGLGWGAAGGLFGYLLSMGTAATTGLVCGKPPWRAGVWLEALLKGLAGAGVGALLYWLAASFASFPLPFELPGAAVGTAWTHQPLFYAPLIAGLFGSLVELDNTGEGGGKGTSKKKGNKGNAKTGAGTQARVADDLELVVPEPVDEVEANKRSGRG